MCLKRIANMIIETMGRRRTSELDSYVKSLLHFDGDDGSTTFTDEIGKIWNNYGSSQIDTASYKFGGASGFFGGTGNYITTGSNVDFNIGSGDFTIDAWVRIASLTASRTIIGNMNYEDTSYSFFVTIYSNGCPYAAIQSVSGQTYNIFGSTPISNYTDFNHIAFVRSGNTIYLFKNGILGGTKDVTGITVKTVLTNISIGRMGEYASYDMNGWIDELRFSKGIARWTSNFTPPTSAYR
jgi:hypothetical protein